MKEDMVYIPVEAMEHFQVEKLATVDSWVEEVAMVDHQVEVELAILVVKLAISIMIVQRAT